MQATLSEIPIIRTTVLKRLETLVQQVANTAELAMVKGPAGIGKTFAIDHITETAKGFDVYAITARTEIAGNIRWMANELLHPHGIQESQVAESMQSVWNLVARRPFDDYPSRSVLIIDEAQTLKPSVLESFRGLFDMGERARIFGGNKLAFGMILVGNGTFLNRAGGARRVAYEPLMQRFQYKLEFGRPSRADYELFIKDLPGTDTALKAELVELGLSKGSIRAVAKAWRAAAHLASGQEPSADVLQTVIKMMGGA